MFFVPCLKLFLACENHDMCMSNPRGDYFMILDRVAIFKQFYFRKILKSMDVFKEIISMQIRNAMVVYKTLTFMLILMY